jgi:hypothetical protein
VYRSEKKAEKEKVALDTHRLSLGNYFKSDIAIIPV